MPSSLKTLLTDVRVGLSVLLAGQGIIADAVQGLPAAAKIVSSVFAVLGVVLGVVTAIQDLPAPVAPPAPPAA